MVELAQLITAIATLIFAIGSVVVGVRNTRRIEQIHVATNSMKDELVRVTASSSKAEGNLEGRAELRHEQRANDTEAHSALPDERAK